MLPCPCHRSQFIRHPAYHQDQSSCSLLIITMVISVLSPVMSGPGSLTSGVGPALAGRGPQVQARPGCLGRRGAISGLRTPAQCRPDTRSSRHRMGAAWHRGRDYMRCWVVTSSKKPGPLTNIAQVPTLGSETGSLVSGAAFISSAPATWHPPPTQVSPGRQWNYLNVPRETSWVRGK